MFLLITQNQFYRKAPHLVMLGHIYEQQKYEGVWMAWKMGDEWVRLWITFHLVLFSMVFSPYDTNNVCFMNLNILRMVSVSFSIV